MMTLREVSMSKLTDALHSAKENLSAEDYAVLQALYEDKMKQKKFGLVWEEGHPGYERLWDKPIKAGSLVHTLKPRGNSTILPNPLVWTVESINEDDNTANLVRKTGSKVHTETWTVEDLVVVASLEEKQLSGLVPDGEVIGSDENDVYHTVINAENLRALEALTFTHAGKMDAIYIDPPYNTGAKDWKYNNDYVDGNDEYKHSKWLSFMDQRLRIAKTLLNPENSVLILTIDEKEYLRTGLLLEEIFSEARIQMVSSVINPKGVSRNTFGRVDEYLFFVMLGESKPLPIKISDEWTIGEKRSNIKPRWLNLRRSGSNSSREHSPGCFYPVFIYNTTDGSKFHSVGESIPRGASPDDVDVPDGCVALWPIRSDGSHGCYQQQPKNLRILIEKGYVKIGKWKGKDTALTYLFKGEQKKIENGLFTVEGRNNDGSVILGYKNYSPVQVAPSQWRVSSHNASEYGTMLIKSLLGDKRFSYPKSLYAVEDALRFFVKDKPDATILDFFGGSGTTAHAVMRLNLEDGGSRKAIIVSNNEVSDEEDKKFSAKGLRPGDEEWDKYGICQYVTKPRVKAAITGKTATSGFTENIKGNYRYNQEFPMSDGIKANARFFNLVALDADAVEFGEGLAEILPLLWVRSGSTGHMITEGDALNGYAISETYAVLFDIDAQAEMIEELNTLGSDSKVKDVYVMDASDESYREIVSKLHGKFNVDHMPNLYLKSLNF